MATLTIRNLDDEIKRRLRIKGAEHGRSMEAEARSILTTALCTDHGGKGLGSQIHSIFADVGPEASELPDRQNDGSDSRIPDFSEY